MSNQPGPREECRQYKAMGWCRFGADCRYSHPSIPAPANTSLPGQSRQRRPRERSLHPEAWEEELPSGYPQRDWLLAGIKHGFHIVKPEEILSKEVYCENYLNDHQALVEKQIQFELDHGHYKPVPVKPLVVSALGAIPKKDGNSIRLIHDCSRPTDNCVNSYAISDPFQYKTLNEDIDMIIPNCYVAKVDLSQA